MNKKTYLLLLITLIIACSGCKKEDVVNQKITITLKEGIDYTQDDAVVPEGGKLQFGVKATNGGAIITYLRIQRIADGILTTEKDQGLYLKDSLDIDINFYKSASNQEEWRFFVMNSDRDSASATLTINLGSGTSYGEINHFPSIIIGMQDNTTLPNYLDLHTGNLYTKTNVSGFEANIDLVGFVYKTSGVLSPTLCCPGYTGSSSVTAADRYPEIEPWSIKRLTSYDYYSSDNNLVNPTEFDHAQNDSLLLASFKPEKISGLCKFCTTGRIIPFKTEDNKYGLIHVLYADTTRTGYMELDIKIQK